MQQGRQRSPEGTRTFPLLAISGLCLLGSSCCDLWADSRNFVGAPVVVFSAEYSSLFVMSVSDLLNFSARLVTAGRRTPRRSNDVSARVCFLRPHKRADEFSVDQRLDFFHIESRTSRKIARLVGFVNAILRLLLSVHPTGMITFRAGFESIDIEPTSPAEARRRAPQSGLRIA
jgi:hypothetical protein